MIQLNYLCLSQAKGHLNSGSSHQLFLQITNLKYLPIFIQLAILGLDKAVERNFPTIIQIISQKVVINILKPK